MSRRLLVFLVFCVFCLSAFALIFRSDQSTPSRKQKCYQVVSSPTLNGLGRLEWNTVLCYPHISLLLIGYQSGVDSKRSHPVRKFGVEEVLKV